MSHMLLALITLLLWGNRESMLKEHRGEIEEAARAFGISPRVLASVVYAERSLNVRLGEDIVDVVLARTGHNSSVGLAQVKVETAFWISEQLHDPASQFYLGPDAAQAIPPTRDWQELIDRLTDHRGNLLYAAAYIAMIQKSWGSVLGTTVNGSHQAGILATLYSLGLQRSDGSTRTPHQGARANHFGETAREFYDSFLLREEFSQ